MFEDSLLVPTHRGMTPTAKALELLDPLRDALDQLRTTLQTHQDFSPAHAILTVTIACSDYVEAAVVLPLMLALRQKAPAVRVAVRHLNPAQLERRSRFGDSNAGARSIAAARPPPVRRNLCAQWPARSSASEERPDDRGICSPRTCDRVAPGRRLRDADREALAALGHKREVVLSAASFHFLPEIVSTSDLVALVPRRLLHSQLDRLTLIDIPWLPEHFSVGLLWHERSHGLAGQRWVRDLLVELTVGQSEETRPARGYGPVDIAVLPDRTDEERAFAVREQASAAKRARAASKF